MLLYSTGKDARNIWLAFVGSMVLDYVDTKILLSVGIVVGVLVLRGLWSVVKGAAFVDLSVCTLAVCYSSGAQLSVLLSLVPATAHAAVQKLAG